MITSRVVAMDASLLLLGAGRALLLVYSVVSIHLATKALGAGQVGVMNLITSATMLFGLVVGAVSLYLYRYVFEWQKAGRLAWNLSKYARFLVLSAIAASVLLTMANKFVPVWAVVPAWQLHLLVGGNLILASLNAALLYCVNGFVSRIVYVVLSNVSAWLGLGIAFLTITVAGKYAVLWLGGLLAGQAVVLIMAALVLWNNGVLRSDGESSVGATEHDFIWRKVVVFSWPLILAAALYWVQRGSAMSFVGTWSGMQQLGYFSVALSVGMLALASFETVFREFYSPVYLRAILGKTGGASVEAWTIYTNLYVPSLIVVATMVATCSASVLKILAGSDYAEHSDIAVLGVWCQLMISVYSQYVVLANTFAENTTLLMPCAVGAVTVLALLILAGRYNSMEGAALAVAVGVSISTALLAYRMRRLHGVNLPRIAMIRSIVLSVPMPVLYFAASAAGFGDSLSESLLLLIACGTYAAILLASLGHKHSGSTGK
jgi:hypothetical protein